MFILNKILAVYVGPAGLCCNWQFQNFIQMVTTFAGSAINTAVIKYTAEYHENEHKQISVWRAAGSSVLIFSFIFSHHYSYFSKAIITLYFSDHMSINLFLRGLQFF